MKILITGGCIILTYVALNLLSNGYEIIIIDLETARETIKSIKNI